MIAWPVIERELRIRSRKPAVYFGRVLAVAIGASVAAPRLLGIGMVVGAEGRFLLNVLVGTAFAIACGSCLLTADAISAERREGTLPLLFTTRLSSIDVLIGKLVPAGMVSLCALLAFIPAFMLAQILGGVTAGETMRKGLAVMNGLFLSLTIGLLVSAHENDRFRAARIAILVTLAIELIPFFIGATGFSWVSPMRTAVLADDVNYTASPVAYWLSLLMVQAAGWLILLKADSRIRTILRNDINELHDFEEGTSGEASALPDRPPPLRNMNPVAWLVIHQPGMGAAAVIAAILTVVFSATIRLGSGLTGFGGGGFVTWPLFLAMALTGDALFAWAACRFLLTARRTAEIELLMTTPLGAGSIISGQWYALLVVLGPAVGLALLGRGLWVGIDISTATTGSAIWGMIGHVLVPSVQYLVELVAVCALGMWFGLSTRSQPAAIIRTVLFAKGVPYLVALIWSVFTVHSVALGGPTETIYRLPLWLGQSIALAWPLVMIWWARRRLREALPGTGASADEPRPPTTRFYWDLGTDVPAAG